MRVNGSVFRCWRRGIAGRRFVLGILCATLANHALAAWMGTEVAAWVGPATMRVLAVTFIVMAGWCLIPDKAGEGPQAARKAGAFLATLVAFFLVKIGDKTQIATVALASRVQSLTLVTLGATFGMLIAKRLPLKIVRIVAALPFVALAVAVILMPAVP